MISFSTFGGEKEFFNCLEGKIKKFYHFHYYSRQSNTSLLVYSSGFNKLDGKIIDYLVDLDEVLYTTPFVQYPHKSFDDKVLLELRSPQKSTRKSNTKIWTELNTIRIELIQSDKSALNRIKSCLEESQTQSIEYNLINQWYTKKRDAYARNANEDFGLMFVRDFHRENDGVSTSTSSYFLDEEETLEILKIKESEENFLKESFISKEYLNMISKTYKLSHLELIEILKLKKILKVMIRATEVCGFIGHWASNSSVSPRGKRAFCGEHGLILDAMMTQLESMDFFKHIKKVGLVHQYFPVRDGHVGLVIKVGKKHLIIDAWPSVIDESPRIFSIENWDKMKLQENIFKQITCSRSLMHSQWF